MRSSALGFAGAVLSISAVLVASSSTETAVANGDTRTLHLYHTHTHEYIDATFRVDGRYDPAVLRQLNHFLRDWRNNDEINMDPRLFDTLWEVYRTAGATQPIQIYSAYRSPETNAMLRRRSRAVAEHSQHMLGKAMDTTIPGFPMHLVREVGMKLQHGGVGWYPSANFVHLDVGGVRSWPRMSYEQLAQLFPDGKTVHIASNGQVLPGYEAARAEIASRGDIDVPPAQESQGFFAWLFGGGSSSTASEDEEDRRSAVASAAPPPAPAQPAPRTGFAQAALAYADPETAPAAAPARSAIDDAQVGAAPARPGLQKLAKLEVQGAAESDVPGLLALPMPPRRPTDLAELADIPLPPARPSFAVASAAPGSRKDPIGSLIATSSNGLPALRRSQLPAIITQGDRSRSAPRALAFAEPNAALASVLDAAPMPIARPATARPLGLRAAFHEQHKRPAAAAEPSRAGSDKAPGELAGAGPQLTGLRRAARLMAAKASL